jgi:hypothetical protein
MVLEYARKHFGVKCGVLFIKKIAKATKTIGDGAAPKDAENINALLRMSKPPIKFQTMFMSVKGTVHYNIYKKRVLFPRRKSPSG